MMLKRVFVVAWLVMVLPHAAKCAVSIQCQSLSAASFSSAPILPQEINYALGTFVPGDEISISIFSSLPFQGGLQQAFALVDGSGNVLAGPLTVPSGQGSLQLSVTSTLNSIGVENLGNFAMYVGAASCVGPASAPAIGRSGLLAMFVLIAWFAISALKASRRVRNGA